MSVKVTAGADLGLRLPDCILNKYRPKSVAVRFSWKHNSYMKIYELPRIQPDCNAWNTPSWLSDAIAIKDKTVEEIAFHQLGNWRRDVAINQGFRSILETKRT
jgi:hypothetical protein